MWEDLRKCFDLPVDLQDSAHANFVAWEKLRVYFCAILAVVTVLSGVLGYVIGLVFLPPGYMTPFERILLLTGFCFFGAFGANVAFCAGPVAEGYFALWGFRRGIVRLVLFVLGLLVGAGGAALTAGSIMGGW
jgi:hypothetical protein